MKRPGGQFSNIVETTGWGQHGQWKHTLSESDTTQQPSIQPEAYRRPHTTSVVQESGRTIRQHQVKRPADTARYRTISQGSRRIVSSTFNFLPGDGRFYLRRLLWEQPNTILNRHERYLTYTLLNLTS